MQLDLLSRPLLKKFFGVQSCSDGEQLSESPHALSLSTDVRYS